MPKLTKKAIPYGRTDGPTLIIENIAFKNEVTLNFTIGYSTHLEASRCARGDRLLFLGLKYPPLYSLYPLRLIKASLNETVPVRRLEKS